MVQKTFNLISLSIMFLGFCFLIGAWMISTALKQDLTNEQAVISPMLWSETEAAQYLNLSEEKFHELLSKQIQEKAGLSSHNTYRFIPYIEIDHQKLFNKEQLDKWIEYNMLNK